MGAIKKSHARRSTIKKLVPKEMNELVKMMDDDGVRRSAKGIILFQQQASLVLGSRLAGQSSPWPTASRPV